VGTDPDVIVRAARTLLDDPIAWERMASARNPFGDGRASMYIADWLERYLLGRVLTPRSVPALA
jgi:UDP-N-acetylglucosamine 2-epimerase (non-hydrolysing)